MSVKFYKVLTASIFILIFVLFPFQAKAVSPLAIAAVMAVIPLILGLLKGLVSFGVFVVIAPLVALIAGKLIDSAIFFQNTLFNPEKITAIQIVWTILRDFVNIFFILILLVAAFATIFNIKNYKAGEILPKLIVAALLINFSLVITVWVVDLLWIPTTVFLNSLGDGISGKMANALSLPKFFSIENIKTDIVSYIKGGPEGVLFREVIFRGITLALNAFILCWIALILWVRIPIIMGLMIVSPIAWLGFALPAIKKQSWDAWWQKLFCWASIPIPLFGLIYFIVFFNQRLKVEMNQIFGSTLGIVLPDVGLTLGEILIWLVTAGIFIGGLMYIKGLSCSLYGWVMAGFTKTWKGVGKAVDFGYAATGYKGATGKLGEDVAKLGFFGTAARKAREARREEQLRGIFGMEPSYAVQKDILDKTKEEEISIENRFKQVKSAAEQDKIIEELRTKIEEGAKDSKTLAAINALAKKGQLDVKLFNQTVKNFKDMPLVLTKVLSEWKEGKFGGLTKAEDLLAILKDDRLSREAKALGYVFVASKDGGKAAEKMTLDDYSRGYQILGKNTREGREFKKNLGKLRPSMVAMYNWEHRTEEFEPDKMPKDISEAVMRQIEGASAKDFSEFSKDEWDNPNFRTGFTKLLIEKRRQALGSERKFKQEVVKRFIREGKGKQLRTLNEIPPFMDIKEVNMGEPPEETESTS